MPLLNTANPILIQNGQIVLRLQLNIADALQRLTPKQAAVLRTQLVAIVRTHLDSLVQAVTDLEMEIHREYP